MSLWKRKLPLICTILFGVMGFILQLVPAFRNFLNIQNQWMTILFGFAIVIGVASLTKYHFKKIKQKPEERIFSYITFSSLIVMAIATLFGMKAESGLFNVLYKNLFDYVFVPLDATIFSLLAFYITSAAFRAFKASSWLSTVLLLAGGIVMLGRVAFGPLMIFGELTQWIMSVPTVAAMRGIKIGIGLGMMATAIKIILGVERSFLGGE